MRELWFKSFFFHVGASHYSLLNVVNNLHLILHVFIILHGNVEYGAVMEKMTYNEKDYKFMAFMRHCDGYVYGYSQFCAGNKGHQLVSTTLTLHWSKLYSEVWFVDYFKWQTLSTNSLSLFGKTFIIDLHEDSDSVTGQLQLCSRLFYLPCLLNLQFQIISPKN